jgi:hypothetical protein
MSDFENGLYDNDTGELILAFDTYIENTYHNPNTVAFEPLEKGSFSSDSKQTTPEMISITAIFSIKGNSTVGATVDKIKQTLIDLNKGTQLVIIILQPQSKKSQGTDNQYYQYASFYQNMALYNIDYQNNPEQLEFRPTLYFQEIRITNTEYTNSQNTANPEDSSTSNAGQVQPKADTSFAFDRVGKVGLPLQ